MTHKLNERSTDYYNLRPLKLIDYSESGKDEDYKKGEGEMKPLKITGNKRKRKDREEEDEVEDKVVRKSRTKKRKADNNEELWDEFNSYDTDILDGSYGHKEWVSASAVKNYLLKDPLLDWLKLYYVDLGFGGGDSNGETRENLRENKSPRDESSSKLSILFEMGNKFEDAVLGYLRSTFPGKVKRVIQNTRDVNQGYNNVTKNYMLEGVPIIEQAVLYNVSNKTFGVADLIIRSDWINKIVETDVLDSTQETLKAPLLKGNYHYRVIDIKWTTLHLCADGELIRNSQMFPAYKGQLAIYNAALGKLQGYTPDKAYILAKAWKYEEKGNQHSGYNSFDLLGHIDFNKFDKKYIDETKKAVDWVRDVRLNGAEWNCIEPTVPQLYPNMCNGYDAPFHHVKKNLADILHEPTQIWMVGIKNRNHAHAQGVYSWNDSRCTTDALGIYGKKVAPVVSAFLEANRDTDNDKLITPDKITNNTYNWQSKKENKIYVDFETINSCFYNKDINLTCSKLETNVINYIGVTYRENGEIKEKEFYMNRFSIEEEKRIVSEFVTFMEAKSKECQQKNKLDLVTVHWGHAERSMFLNCNKRHGNIWTKFYEKMKWLDFCKVCQDEPIIPKGAKKFNLKEYTKPLYDNSIIKTYWDKNGPDSGLTAMMNAINYYKFMDEYETYTPEEKMANAFELLKQEEYFTQLSKYNKVDRMVMLEFVEYLINTT